MHVEIHMGGAPGLHLDAARAQKLLPPSLERIE